MRRWNGSDQSGVAVEPRQIEKNKHATKHFAATQHPIIMSYEHGEEWGWCYVDQGYFESLPDIMKQLGKAAPPTR